MKALILAADGFEDSELLVPLYRLLEENIEVEVASPDARKITGKHGYQVEPSKGLHEVKASDYDLLILPGGKGPETVRLNENAIAITRSMLDSDKPVGAICHGPQILISAGELKGRRATCYVGMRDDLKLTGAIYEDAEVVVDGNLVTSRMPDDLPAFCRELMRLIRK